MRIGPSFTCFIFAAFCSARFVLLVHLCHLLLHPVSSLAAAGYSDRYCGKCSSDYYRLQGRCVPCPSQAAAMWVAMFAAALAGVLLILYTSRPDDGKLFSPSIAVTFVQLLSLFHSFPVPWPSAIITIFDLGSAANLNTELFAPECAVPLDFYAKWRLKM